MPKCPGRKDFLNFPLQDFHKKDSNTRFDKKDSNTKNLSPDIVGKRSEWGFITKNIAIRLMELIIKTKEKNPMITLDY